MSSCRVILLCRRLLGSPLFGSYYCSIVTIDNFKPAFKQAQGELCNQQCTAQQAGFQANGLSCNPTQQQDSPLQETAEGLANLATGTASDLQAFQNLTNTVSIKSKRKICCDYLPRSHRVKAKGS